MKWPKISIVTPNYNQGRYIEATIRSIIEQQYPNLEYYIFDGGSTDSSIEILRRYEKNISGWVSQKDNGQGDAIRRGFRKTSGDILGWINADDVLLPGSLQSVALYFLENPEQMWVVGGSIFINEKNQLIKTRLGFPKCNHGSVVSYNRLLFWQTGFNQPASFWRREIYFKSGEIDPSFKFCLDYDLYFRFAKYKKSGKLNRFIAAFRIHDKSKTSRWEEIRKIEDEKLFKKYGKYNKNIFLRTIMYLWYDWAHKIVIRLGQIRLLFNSKDKMSITTTMKGKY